MKNSVHMHIKGGVPGLGCQLQQSAVDWSACGVDQHVHGAKLLAGLLDAAGGLCCRREIGLDQQTSAFQRLNLPLGLFGLGIKPSSDDSYISPFRSEEHTSELQSRFGI